MNRNPLLTLFFLTALLSQTTFAHPGRLDSSGCHHEKKTGGYHCHNGNSQPPSVPQPQVTEPSSAETPYEVKQGLTCSSYLKEGDSLNDNGQTESAYKNYLEAYKIAKTKEQKKAVLASLAVTSLKREQTGESLQYLQELLTLFPDNKWAIDFVKKK
ncbi:MAG: hypothetical protein BWK79_00190 [Beggiatoa sp. IS2]|nr:MAG: hypothetical protein BWK78_00080 [Thiotrichaceae bacterium IS1]OQW96073.1 MAG: hypothetical protein BWK79_00190 [Beggiatoa sp. IS2]